MINDMIRQTVFPIMEKDWKRKNKSQVKKNDKKEGQKTYVFSFSCFF